MEQRPSVDGMTASGRKTKSAQPTTLRRSVAYLVGGGLGSTLLYAAGGLLIGRLVEPATLGLFNGISLVLGYVTLLGLGVSTGLQRELPYFVGKGDRPKAEEMAAVTQAWSLVVGSAVFVALLGVAGWQLAQGDMWKAAGWFTNAIMALMLFYTDYLQVTYRTAHDFGRIALVRVVQQAALVALVVLVVPLDFYGLCLRMLLAGGLSAFLLFRARPVRVGPGWNLDDLKHLLRIGMPIFLVYQVFAYWIVIDKTLVLRLGGTHMMGLYAMVVMVVTAVDSIPGAVSQVLYPRMTEQYGRGQSLGGVARGIVKPTAVTAVVIVPVILVGWWLVGPLSRWLIPQYAEAVPAMQWALLLSFVRCFETIYALFSVGRRQRLRLVGVLTGIAAYVGSLFWLISGGIYLAAFPQAMLIGRSVSLLVSYALIHRLLTRGRDSNRPDAEGPG